MAPAPTHGEDARSLSNRDILSDSGTTDDDAITGSRAGWGASCARMLSFERVVRALGETLRVLDLGQAGGKSSGIVYQSNPCSTSQNWSFFRTSRPNLANKMARIGRNLPSMGRSWPPEQSFGDCVATLGERWGNCGAQAGRDRGHGERRTGRSSCADV